MFAVSLTDLVTGPAKRMQKSLLDESKALMAANQSTAMLERSMQGLERAMVKSAAVGDVKAYQKQARDLAMLRVAYDQADKSGLKMAESLKAQAASAGDTAASLKAYTGIVAAAGVAALALATAVGKATLAGAEFTLSAVQEKQAAQQMFRAMAGGKEAGDQLFAMMEDLATVLPQTKTQLTAWSKEFTAMGILKTDALRTELRATASAAALMGDDGAEAFTTLTRKITEAAATSGKLKLADKQMASLAKTGANVADVAAVMGISAQSLAEGLKAGTVNATKFGDALNAALEKKGAGSLNRLLGTTDVLMAKFKEAIGDMFEDIDVTPFTDALRSLVAVFGQTSASGKAMKSGVSVFFTALFAWAGKAVLVMTHFFLGTIIFGLKAYLAIKPWIPLLKALGMVIAIAATLFALTFAPAVWAGVVALGALIATAAVAAWPFLAIAAVVVGVYEAFTHWSSLVGFVSGLFGALGSTISGWAAAVSTWATEAAGNLIGGLVNGISSGAGLVWDAIKGLGTGAMNALKHVLGIASPSKEFAKLGLHTARGFTQGLLAANDNVMAASSGLADMAVAGVSRGAASAQASAPATSKGGLSITIAPGAIVITGATGDATELTEHALSLILEKVALSQGLAA